MIDFSDRRFQSLLMLLFLSMLVSCGESESESESKSESFYHQFPCSKGSLEEQIACLKKSPRENSEYFLQTKEQYGIYYSVTTSPKRIKKLKHIFDLLDFSTPMKVFVVLPALFRNKEPYSDEDIAAIKQYSDKIEVLRPARDLGPIMKLLPAVELLQRSNLDLSKQLVMTIDDDIGYSAGLPEQLLMHAMKTHAAVGGNGHSQDFWGVRSFLNPTQNCESSNVSYCDVLEGYHGAVYPVDLVDVIEMRSIAKLPECKFSDDIVISYVLSKHNVDRILLRNKYLSDTFSFRYGLDSDALHVLEENSPKYQKCMQTILKKF